MKASQKDKPIHTIPEGAWEAGRIREQSDSAKSKNPNDITTDLQGNGYPYPAGQQKKTD